MHKFILILFIIIIIIIIYLHGGISSILRLLFSPAFVDVGSDSAIVLPSSFSSIEMLLNDQRTDIKHVFVTEV